jgi:hypothetical protein
LDRSGVAIVGHAIQAEKRRWWNSGSSDGFSVEETAEVLDISPETVMRDWKCQELGAGELSRTKSGARDA